MAYLNENIILIGFMGSGKSTVGRALSELLQYPLLDTDNIIEKEEGRSISQIFEIAGEEYFRAKESELLKRLLDQNIKKHIISTGGGIPMKNFNRSLIRAMGYVVWLDANAETISQRTSDAGHRPLLEQKNRKEVIASLLQEREPIYEEVSHLCIPTFQLSVEEIAHGVLESARYYYSNEKKLNRT